MNVTTQRLTRTASAAADGCPPSARAFTPSIIFRSITKWIGSKTVLSKAAPSNDGLGVPSARMTNREARAPKGSTMNAQVPSAGSTSRVPGRRV
jgi:hypothetical protein